MSRFKLVATIRWARKEYFLHMQAGMDQGRRPELTGDDLIRSVGGWEAVKKMRLKGQGRIKGDDRILGDTDFVNSLLSGAEEKISLQQELKNEGYDIRRLSLFPVRSPYPVATDISTMGNIMT